MSHESIIMHPNDDPRLPSRRDMLKAAGCGLMTNVSLMSTFFNLQATKALAAGSGGAGGYKALVCLFLYGGNDSFNMLVPLDGDSTSGEFGDYTAVRGGYDDGVSNPGGLALQQSSLLPIAGPSGRQFGLHPSMPEIAELYSDTNPDSKYKNKIAFLANVGAISRPITRLDYDNNVLVDNVPARPLGLFSHADFQKNWQTSIPQSRSGLTGWGGRMSDLMADTNSNDKVSMNISLGGVNVFQAGKSVIPYAIANTGATVVQAYGSAHFANQIFVDANDSILSQTYTNLLAKSLAETSRNSIDAAIEFNNAINSVSLNTVFDTETLSADFATIARVIAARTALQQTRQVFFVAIHGWDNHSELINTHASNLQKVSRALSSFYEATVEMGVENDVTTVTASDFGRTLSSNGQGSDHAWGANHLMMGGCVDGGKIYGEYPTSLLNPQHSIAGNLNLGRGRFLPTTSVDEFAAEIAMWFGVANGPDLESVLPNIREFYASGGSTGPLGMYL